MYYDVCDCGQPKTRIALHCFACASKLRRKVDRPSKEQLEKELAENTASALARKYGVSSVTIGKWKRSYGIESEKYNPEQPENVVV